MEDLRRRAPEPTEPQPEAEVGMSLADELSAFNLDEALSAERHAARLAEEARYRAEAERRVREMEESKAAEEARRLAMEARLKELELQTEADRQAKREAEERLQTAEYEARRMRVAAQKEKREAERKERSRALHATGSGSGTATVTVQQQQQHSADVRVVEGATHPAPVPQAEAEQEPEPEAQPAEGVDTEAIVRQLVEMFPMLGESVVRKVVEVNEGNMEACIQQLLQLAARAEQKRQAASSSSSSTSNTPDSRGLSGAELRRQQILAQRKRESPVARSAAPRPAPPLSPELPPRDPSNGQYEQLLPGPVAGEAT